MDIELENLLQGSREMLLVTTGRKSGLARQVELWFAYDAGFIYLLAGVGSTGTPMNWYRNLLAKREATLLVGERSVNVVSEPVADVQALMSQIWDLFLAKYGGSIMRQWYQDDNHLPVMLRVMG